MTAPDTNDSNRSEVSETDGPVTGADAVPDKTSDTPAKGAEFGESDEADGVDGDKGTAGDDTATGATNDPRGDESIRDQH
jgi:hypothetical protein